MTFIIPNVKVLKVEERFVQKYVSGYGPDTVMESLSLGWYAWFSGSYESLYLGETKPDLAAGDTINISITKQ